MKQAGITLAVLVAAVVIFTAGTFYGPKLPDEVTLQHNHPLQGHNIKFRCKGCKTELEKLIVATLQAVLKQQANPATSPVAPRGNAAIPVKHKPSPSKPPHKIDTKTRPAGPPAPHKE